MIKYILFDLGNVIIEHVLEGKRSYNYDGRIFSGEKIESIYSLIEYEEFSKGNLTEAEFVGKFLKNCDLDLTITEFMKIYENDIKFIKGMKVLLKNLYSNYSLVLLTNEGKEWADRKINHLNLRTLFKKIIISADLHELKPARDFYLKTLNILNAKPEECLFIDDKEKNCKAAKLLGINTIQFIGLKRLKEELKSFSIILD
ncbi:MAG: HAD family phosphatase [Nanoarchaeota archaeon]|nr:HAD family phosphatase [Nanoarchaeota archaeon]MBU4116169.1 HAD family phosphatase [Nanoarchaeota archaeon]